MGMRMEKIVTLLSIAALTSCSVEDPSIGGPKLQFCESLVSKDSFYLDKDKIIESRIGLGVSTVIFLDEKGSQQIAAIIYCYCLDLSDRFWDQNDF